MTTNNARSLLGELLEQRFGASRALGVDRGERFEESLERRANAGVLREVLERLVRDVEQLA